LFSEEVDVFIKLEDNTLFMQSLSTDTIQFEVSGVKQKGKVFLEPGNQLNFNIIQ
jgi:hypothetical protein